MNLMCFQRNIIRDELIQYDSNSYEIECNLILMENKGINCNDVIEAEGNH